MKDTSVDKPQLECSKIKIKSKCRFAQYSLLNMERDVLAKLKLLQDYSYQFRGRTRFRKYEVDHCLSDRGYTLSFSTVIFT